jgi:hypothetical protein
MKKGRAKRPHRIVGLSCGAAARERLALTQTPGAVERRAQFAVSHFAIYDAGGDRTRIK